MKKIFAVLASVVFLGGSLAWFFFFRNSASPLSNVAAGSPTSIEVTSAPLATSTPTTQAIDANHLLYQNAAFHFSLIYPAGLRVEDDEEAGGALTVTFQNSDTNAGFEVYVTPYSGTQVTQQRFRLDEPSGRFDTPQQVVVGGVPATMFFGQNAVMGDTREVWFIHDGYLYEVATYKQLDAWFSQIMTTWKFI